MRVERFETATKCRNGGSNSHGALEAPFTYILLDNDALSCNLMRQHYTRHPAVEGSPHARYKQGYAGEHRGIHDTLAIAANVMFVRHLKPTQQAGKSGDKREAALKSSLANVMFQHDSFVSNLPGGSPVWSSSVAGKCDPGCIA